jgi:hypothetical protein
VPVDAVGMVDDVAVAVFVDLDRVATVVVTAAASQDVERDQGDDAHDLERGLRDWAYG